MDNDAKENEAKAASMAKNLAEKIEPVLIENRVQHSTVLALAIANSIIGPPPATVEQPQEPGAAGVDWNMERAATATPAPAADAPAQNSVAEGVDKISKS